MKPEEERGERGGKRRGKGRREREKRGVFSAFLHIFYVEPQKIFAGASPPHPDQGATAPWTPNAGGASRPLPFQVNAGPAAAAGGGGAAL